MFQASVRKNIDPFGIKDDFYLEGILSRFSEKLKLNFEISANGDNLSIGEKQIISFVRAIISDAQLICLDEAVANIDA